ncbi:MAG: RNHCP domain-containing protein [Chloroflexota bacterium]
MSRTIRHNRRAAQKAARSDDNFRCRNCKAMVGPIPFGGRHRNHCPFCLYSCHVDGKQPGDRASSCGSRMAPVASFTRSNGEYVIVHRCLGCRFERYNRIASDDCFELVLDLPSVPARPLKLAVASDELTA